jgi:hypothetical protein
VTSMQPSFAAFRAPVDREVFAPGFGLWLGMSGALIRLWRAAIALPDRGRVATSDDLPPEYFRFPCY